MYKCKNCGKEFYRKKDKGKEPIFCCSDCYLSFMKSNANRDLQKYNQEYYRKNKDKMKEVTSNYYTKNPEKLLYRRLKSDCNRYNITIEDYVRIYNEQGGKCSICGKQESEFKRKLHIDHNHNTGKFRGLLCHYCNTAIGLLKEDITLLNKAIEYLNK